LGILIAYLASIFVPMINYIDFHIIMLH